MATQMLGVRPWFMKPTRERVHHGEAAHEAACFAREC